jgi:hypothetical protein
MENKRSCGKFGLFSLSVVVLGTCCYSHNLYLTPPNCLTLTLKKANPLRIQTKFTDVCSCWNQCVCAQ